MHAHLNNYKLKNCLSIKPYIHYITGSSSNTNSLCVENNFQFGNIRGSNFVVSFQSDDSQNKHGFLLRYKSTAASSKGLHFLVPIRGNLLEPCHVVFFCIFFSFLLFLLLLF